MIKNNGLSKNMGRILSDHGEIVAINHDDMICVITEAKIDCSDIDQHGHLGNLYLDFYRGVAHWFPNDRMVEEYMFPLDLYAPHISTKPLWNYFIDHGITYRDAV